MKNRFNFLLAVLSLSLAALACSLPNIPGVPGADGSLFSDNFEGFNQSWGTGTDADGAVEYENGGLRFQVFRTGYFIWSSPNEEEYSNIRIEVTAKNNSRDSYAAFGIICYQGTAKEDMYYFAVSPNGDYAIAKAVTGQEDLFLTNDNEWGASSLIPKNAASYRIGAECGNGTLSLFVNGQKVDSVQDATYTTGTVGLFAWNDEQPSGTDVTFDDFVITRLP
ncbi:MAG: hypothetical protein DDG60_08715 [Anaerolineae bacterium]|nr:MAG: hypothetical protein DDG60_08715 [Anaerolineae bacterium]